MIDIFCPCGVVHVKSSIIIPSPCCDAATHARESADCQRPRRRVSSRLRKTAIYELFIARPLYRLEPVAPAPQPNVSRSAYERRQLRRAPREDSMLNCAHLEKRRTGAAACPENLARYAIYYTPQPGTALAAFGRSWLG